MPNLLHGKHKVAKYGKRMFQMDNLENSIVSGNRTGQYLEDRKLLLLHNLPVKHDTNIEYRDFLSLTVLDRKIRSRLFFAFGIKGKLAKTRDLREKVIILSLRRLPFMD